MATALLDAVERLLGTRVVGARALSGGCISHAQRVELADGLVVFVKSGVGLPEGLLAAEAAGLAWLRQADALALPAVLALGTDPALLVLEWIEAGPSQPTTAARLGEGLARLHLTGAPRFGAPEDGFIGSLPQRNTPPGDDWPTFWFTRRIEPLARTAIDQGALAAAAAALVTRLGSRLAQIAGPPEAPARVHGDLWTGNVMVDHAGRPWLVDPTAYGGHREVDLAMLHLFGRPEPATIDAYEAVSPLAGGWRDRLRLWQLEPLLVHAILFGGGYGAQAQRVLAAFGSRG